MTWLAFASENAWKGSIILIAAWTAWAALRRAPAAWRHFLLTIAFFGLAILPGATRFTPKLSAPSLPLTATPVAAPVRAPAPIVLKPRPAPQPVPRNWTLWLWLAGLTISALPFAAGMWHTSRIARSAAAADYASALVEEVRRSLAIRRRVRAFESESVAVPLTWGIAHPVVLLPAGAAGWPAARLRTVVLHEMVHVQRWDLLAQAVAHAACCLFWFHPLAWMALRQLRKERERACDDAVLLRGIGAHDYAGHLMDLVRAMVERRRAWFAAPAMAQASDLEMRVRELLDRSRNRSPLTARAAAVIALAALAVLAPLAVISHAQGPRGSLSGIVNDASGGRVPRARVLAKNLDGANQEVTDANLAGEYRFDSIPAGRYTIEFAAPGFALLRLETEVAAGAASRLDGSLSLGSVQEKLSIQGRRSTVPAATPAAPSPERIRVGGNVTPARVIHQTRPVYPPDAQQAGVEGTVLIRGIITKDGSVRNPRVVNTSIDPRLARAALDAVTEWRYEPALLNGHPVEILTTITLEFHLEE